MTAQEAAYQLLKEIGEPQSSQAIARMALEQGLVHSNARDPVNSIAQTIEKNIRGEVYNQPRLIFIHRNGDRMIGLPGLSTPQDGRPQVEEQAGARVPKVELRVSIAGELMEKIHLADQSGIGDSFVETVVALLESGLQSKKEEIKSGVLKQLKKLDSPITAR